MSNVPLKFFPENMIFLKKVFVFREKPIVYCEKK